MIRAWMWGVWIGIVVGMIWFAIRERRTKGTYWWEPPSRRWTWGIGIPLAIAASWVARSQTWRPFMWGVLAAICVPAFVTGLVYRLELHGKGLKPKYLQGRSASTQRDPGNDL